MPRPPAAIEWLSLAVILLHLFVAPYTKVEESFHVQAVHDLLFRGPHPAALPHYDHLSFPGVVPRTFIGALLLASLGAAPVYLVQAGRRIGQHALIWLNYHAPRLTATIPAFLYPWPEPRRSALLIVRLLLGTLTWLSLVAVRRALPWPDARAFYGIITASQFHLLFYASRPLSNTFALILTNAALACRLQGVDDAGVVLVAVAAAVFRFELALLLMLLFLADAWRAGRSRTAWRALCRRAALALLSAAAAAAVSVLVDSYFWRRRVYPEWEAFRFNAIANRSHEWGTAPWHWYWTSALPRALLFIPTYVPLLPIALLGWTEARQLALPYLGYVACMSALPHKELRFVFYALPVANAAAALVLGAAFRYGWSPVSDEKIARAASALTELDARPYYEVVRETDRKLWTRRFAAVCCALLVLTATVSHTVFLGVSSRNYPGAEALLALHRAHAAAEKTPACARPYVHIDAAAASSGISQFLHIPAWHYSKREYAPGQRVDWRQYTHLVTERAAEAGFERVYSARAPDAWLHQYPFVRFAERIHVLRRRQERLQRSDAEDDSGEEARQALLLPGCWPARLPWS